MPKKSYSYIEKKDVEKFVEKKTIEHLSPSPLPLYDPLNIYNINDKFQDNNGVEYTTVNTNQKFLVLAKTYNSVIKGQNVVVTAYMDPEWFDGNCHLNYKGYNTKPEFQGCLDSRGFISSTFSREPINPINIGTYPYDFLAALRALHPNVAYLNDNNKYGVSDYFNSNPGDDKAITYETGILWGPISSMMEDFEPSNEMVLENIKPRGIYIIFKDSFTPPPIIQINKSFSSILYNSSSSYFSYFFRKSTNNQPDNFTTLISQSNINNEWNEYQTKYREIGNKMAGQCCTIV
jgi:hypothetical protein